MIFTFGLKVLVNHKKIRVVIVVNYLVLREFHIESCLLSFSLVDSLSTFQVPLPAYLQQPAPDQPLRGGARHALPRSGLLHQPAPRGALPRGDRGKGGPVVILLSQKIVDFLEQCFPSCLKIFPETSAKENKVFWKTL